ncbi:hypothetical protein HY950_02150 [Candidatus Gottesmanbacteria bacterium]|nr:hypothetical protein [Candidatus Gottesmanbacteria bacterium]
MTNTINLLQTKTGNTAQFLMWEQKLRSVSIGAVLALFSIGLVAAASYGVLRWERSTLEETRARLIQDISRQRTKEGLLLLTKQRAGIVSNILASQRDASLILDTVATIAVPEQVQTITLDEKGQVRLAIKAESIGAAAAIVAGIIGQAQEKRIVNPQLVGLSLGKDRTIQMTIAFVQSK